jgi:hypothetical protein
MPLATCPFLSPLHDVCVSRILQCDYYRYAIFLTWCKIIESNVLAELGGLPPSDPSNEWCSVRTPRLYHFNTQTNTQVQEYLPSGIDLKNYALKHYEPHTSTTKKAQCLGLGRGLGQWLKHFHEWAEQSSDLRNNAAENKSLQRLKHSTYYDYLIQMIDKFPAMLSQAKEVFESVKAMSERELDDDSALQAVHGDFWTGK